MGSEKNQYGLPRHIPADIALEVRQRSKFGCVCCRNAIYTYEHIDPPWAEATVHKAEAICLLCGTCHSKASKGLLSKETVLRAYERVRTNGVVERPFSEFDLRSRSLMVKLGSCTFTQPRAIFTIDGSDLLAFGMPEGCQGFPQLSGVFCDERGEVLFRINNNEWEGPLSCWDMTVIGRRITVRSSPKKIAIEMRMNPPNMIEVTHLDMRMGSSRVAVTGDDLILERSYANGKVFRLAMNADCTGADSCVYIDSLGPEQPQLRQLRMLGGHGTELFDCGIVFGRGNGISLMRRAGIQAVLRSE